MAVEPTTTDEYRERLKLARQEYQKLLKKFVEANNQAIKAGATLDRLVQIVAGSMEPDGEDPHPAVGAARELSSFAAGAVGSDVRARRRLRMLRMLDQLVQRNASLKAPILPIGAVQEWACLLAEVRSEVNDPTETT